MMNLDWLEESKTWKGKSNVPKAGFLDEQYSWKYNQNQKAFAHPPWLEGSHHWLKKPKHQPPTMPQIVQTSTPVIKQAPQMMQGLQPEYEELRIPVESPKLSQEDLFLKQALEIASSFLPQPLLYAVFIPPPSLSHHGQLVKQLTGSFLIAIHPEFLILATLDRNQKWAFHRTQISRINRDQSSVHLVLNDGREISIYLAKFELSLQNRLCVEIENWMKNIDKKDKNG